LAPKIFCQNQCGTNIDTRSESLCTKAAGVSDVIVTYPVHP